MRESGSPVGTPFLGGAESLGGVAMIVLQSKGLGICIRTCSAEFGL